MTGIPVDKAMIDGTNDMALLPAGTQSRTLHHSDLQATLMHETGDLDEVHNFNMVRPDRGLDGEIGVKGKGAIGLESGTTGTF